MQVGASMSPHSTAVRPRFWARCLMVLAIFSFTFASLSAPSIAMAQGNDAAQKAGGDPPAKKENLLSWTYHALGWKYSLAFFVLSFFLVGLFVMNVIYVRRDAICPMDLIEGVEQSIAENNLEAAAEIVRIDDSFLGHVVAAGLAKLERGKAAAMEAMEVMGEEETMNAEHRLGYMALIGSVAPMIGLLGTVEGMVQSFSVIAQSNQTPPPSQLAQGISMALVTTLFGLYIAIPAIAIYNILRNRFQRLVLEVGTVSEEMLEKFDRGVRR